MNPAKIYFSSFRDEWLSNKYKDWIIKGEDELSCKCKVCNISFTVKHEGCKHLSSDKHKENFKIQSRNTSVFKFMPPKYSTEHDKVTATEWTLTYHGVKHHHSYNSQDCGNKLYSCVFSDSPVVTKISCGRKQSKAIVTSVLLPFTQD